MRRTTTGLGLKNISGKLRSRRAATPGSYAEFSEQQRQQRQSQDILKYGGKGAARKFAYGFVKGFAGEDAAKSFTDRFGNQDQMEEAYQSLQGGEEDTAEKISKEELQKIISQMDNLDSTIREKFSAIIEELDGITATVEKIEMRVSPRDVVIGKGENAQTFRYDPLAPEGKQVKQVTASGKAGIGASKSDIQSVLNKASFFGNQDMEKQTPSAKKISKAEAKLIAEQLVDELEAAPGTTVPKAEDSGEPGKPGMPATYEEYAARQKRIKDAEETLKYGGKGFAKKFKYGFIKGFAGEERARSFAEKTGDAAQQEEAYQTLKAEMEGQKPGEQAPVPEAATGQVQPVPGTQAAATADIQSGMMADKIEAEQEDRKAIIDKLDEILEKLEDASENKNGILSKITSLLAARSLMSGASRLAGAAARFATSPAGLAVGAGAVGYGVGSLANEKLGISDKLVNSMDLGGAQEAALAATKKTSFAETAMKINDKLTGTGYKLVAPGQYQGPDGNVVPKSELPSQVRAKLTGPSVEPKGTVSGTIQRPAGARSYAAVNAQREQRVLQAEAKQAARPRPSAPRRAATPPPPPPAPPKQEPPVIVQTRNMEPSVMTYTASIFDHPVIHPGIYKM